MTNQVQCQIGLVIFPDMTQLDLTGPYQVFALMPDTRVHLLWKKREPVTSNEGMTILPTTTKPPCRYCSSHRVIVEGCRPSR